MVTIQNQALKMFIKRANSTYSVDKLVRFLFTSKKPMDRTLKMN
jgi:hypothetical protein